jgi:hypothetical protein
MSEHGAPSALNGPAALMRPANGGGDAPFLPGEGSETERNEFPAIVFSLCWGTEESAAFVLKHGFRSFVILRYPSVFASHRVALLRYSRPGGPRSRAGSAGGAWASETIVGCCLLNNNNYSGWRAARSGRRGDGGDGRVRAVVHVAPDADETLRIHSPEQLQGAARVLDVELGGLLAGLFAASVLADDARLAVPEIPPSGR